jgi:pimeloyl-ACP methyl ester carboxylesterase
VPSWLGLFVVFIVVGVALVMFVAWQIARALLHPPRMTDGRAMFILRRLSPGDLGLAFEPMRFTVRDAQDRDGAGTLQLAAWWMPNPAASGRCAVLIHGFADAKVGSIAWAPTFHALGYNVLALDLRAHGESDGRHCTAGYFERHDVQQVIDQLSAERPDDAEQIVLFGASLGAAVALATVELLCDDDRLVGVILDSPFADYARAAGAQVALLGAPTTFVMPLAIRIAQWISGARFDELNVPRMIRAAARVPVMVIESDNDMLVGERDRREIAEVMQARQDRGDTFWHVPGAGHLMALASDADEYRKQVASFLAA